MIHHHTFIVHHSLSELMKNSEKGLERILSSKVSCFSVKLSTTGNQKICRIFLYLNFDYLSLVTGFLFYKFFLTHRNPADFGCLPMLIIPRWQSCHQCTSNCHRRETVSLVGVSLLWRMVSFWRWQHIVENINSLSSSVDEKSSKNLALRIKFIN